MGLTVEFLFHLAFLKTPFQAVADGEASLRQEVVEHFGGEGLSQRLETCKTRLSTGRERKSSSLFFCNITSCHNLLVWCCTITCLPVYS